MRPTSGRQTCDCCKDASSQEFGKILELKDVGVTIYRYLPQKQTESQKATENGQVYILQNTGSNDVKLEELIVESGKKKISCPRCMKTIAHVKSLLKELPPAKIREVTGICEHCYHKEFFNCSCCENIVDKFVKTRIDDTKQTEEERERNKSWLITTQLSLKKSFSNVKDSKLESRAKPGDQTKESYPSQAQKTNFVSETYKKPGVKVESAANEQKKYRPSEEDIEKELRVQMPLKDFLFGSRKLEPRERPEARGQEYEITATATIKPLQEHEPVSGTYGKQMTIIESELNKDQKNLYRLPEEDTEAPLRDEITFKKYFSEMKNARLEPNTRSESRIQDSQIPTSRYISTKKPTQEPVPFLEIYEKQRLKGKSELHARTKSAEEILQKPLRVLSFLDFPVEDIKSLPKKEKTGILKSREDSAPEGVSKPTEKSKTALTSKQHSFETVMKSLSEPNVSDFSYTFPHEKIMAKKQMKRQISSSELIKNTQEMLQEREEAEKKKNEELERLKEEKRRLAEEKKRKREDEKRKQDEEKAIKDKQAELDEQGEERDRVTERKKRDDKAAATALKEQLDKQAKELSENEKSRKQYEKDRGLGEKKAREAQKTIEDKGNQQTTEKKTVQTKPDSADGHKKDGKDQDDKSEKLAKRDKGHELAATTALKDQVAKQSKEKSEEEKLRKQREHDIKLGEKMAKGAEKAIEDKQKQLSTEKRKKLSDIKPDGKDDKTDKEKGQKVETPAKEQKLKEDTNGDMAAMLREQMAKKQQQELEREKIRKEQQKEKELAEKKLKELQVEKEEKVPVIKPVILKPEVISDEEDVSEVILKAEEVTDVIKGLKIYKVKRIKRVEEALPILESKFAGETKGQTEKEKERGKTDKEGPELQNRSEQTAKQLKQITEHKTVPGALDTQDKLSITNAKKSKPPDPEATKGVIRYTLSDRTFIDKGWTMLPTEKVVRKMNVYRMRPAKPEFDWFEHNKYKRQMTYDTGERLAEFDDNGRGRWYYRSGELALDYYDAEETNAGQRFVVYSTGQPDERGRSRPRTILATFDFSGNGIVFDHTGKIRLKYNQTEGVVLDRTIGPVSHWKWHTLNDPPVLQQVMIDTQMPFKDPTILKLGDKNADQKRPDNEEMVAIEFENFLKSKREKLTQSFKPFQIKMKAMKINENFSLRVLDQASVYLLFRDGTTNLKINLGMVLDHKEIVDTDTAEIGEVSNTLDKLPACTDSIAGLQRAVAQAQMAERIRVRHERRLKRPEEIASVDALRAGCSRPPRTPIVQASLTSCDKMTPKRFKPSCCELYYSTQLC